MIMKSMGMLNDKALALNSMNSLNFGYALFLLLNSQSKLSQSEIEHIVKRWLALSAVTARYGSSPETTTEKDIKQFANGDPFENLASIERQVLTEPFWNTMLPDDILVTSSSTNNNAWRLFQMAQVKDHDVAWLEDFHKVEDLLREQGNVHHIFPRAYLKRYGFGKQAYNQIANYILLTQSRNLLISDAAPVDYLHNSQVIKFSNEENWQANGIPIEVKNMTYNAYYDFLFKRRRLIANRIRKYYESL